MLWGGHDNNWATSKEWYILEWIEKQGISYFNNFLQK